MNELLLSFPAVEERIDDEEARLSGLSSSTLAYMHAYGVAWEQWLRHHRAMLRYEAEEEHDLFEAMRLSSRLNRVSRNIAERGARNERIHAHLLSRQIED